MMTRKSRLWYLNSVSSPMTTQADNGRLERAAAEREAQLASGGMVTSRHHQLTLHEYETALQHLLALLTVKLSATHSHGPTTRPRSHAGESHMANEHHNNDNSPGARIWPGSPTKIVTRAQLDERCVFPTCPRCVNLPAGR